MTFPKSHSQLVLEAEREGTVPLTLLSGEVPKRDLLSGALDRSLWPGVSQCGPWTPAERLQRPCQEGRVSAHPPPFGTSPGAVGVRGCSYHTPSNWALGDLSEGGELGPRRCLQQLYSLRQGLGAAKASLGVAA